MSIILVSLMISGTGPAMVAPQIVWQTSFQATSVQFSAVKWSVSAAPNGVYAAAGGELRKYDLNGNLEWTDEVGGAITSLAADPSGVYAVGNVVRYTGGGFYVINATLARIGSDGNVKWVREFKGPIIADENEWRVTAVAASNEGIYIAGYAVFVHRHPTYWFIAKFDAVGNEQWLRTEGCFGGNCIGIPTGIALDSLGVFISGVNSCDIAGELCNSDAIVFALDLNGGVSWTREIVSSCPRIPNPPDSDPHLSCTISQTLRKPNDLANDIAVSSKGIFVVGAAQGEFEGQAHQSYGPYSYDAFVRKYDFNGTEQWTRQYGTQNQAGGVYAGGTYGLGISVDQKSIFIVSTDGLRQLDSSGNELWSLSLNFATNSVSTAPRGLILVDGDSAIAEVCASRSCMHG